MTHANANKVAINSLALYVNMVVTMGATLLGTRFVLQALGRADYGIYALIASMVALFSFLNIAMAAATQRYLSFAMGEGKDEDLHAIFYGSVLIHLFIAAGVALVLLAGGSFAVGHGLDIAPDMRGAAYVVLWFVTGGLVATILAVPNEGTMNAHEDMVAVAVINMTEALLKLGAAVAVLFIGSHQLEWYAGLIMGAQVFSFLAKRTYCLKHYAETRFRFHRPKDWALLRQMLAFAGWNFIGTGCNMARYQGTAILLNLFFGLVTNAAYGVAQQVNGFLVFFAGSIVRPLRPRLIKCEGAGEHERMIELAFTTGRITFLMLLLIFFPLAFHLPYVLGLWLHEVPEKTDLFCLGFLLIVLINQSTVGLNLALESVGRIRRVQEVCGSLHLVALPLGLLFFALGYPAESILYAIIGEELLCIVLRLRIAQKDAGVPVGTCVRTMLVPQWFTAALGLAVAWAVHAALSLLSLGAAAAFWVELLLLPTLTALLGYACCLQPAERVYVKRLLRLPAGNH